MGWGFWKKLKNGFGKVASIGKQLIKKITDDVGVGVGVVSKVIPVVSPVLNEVGIDTTKVDNVLKKNAKMINDGIRKVTGAVSFNGKSWNPNIIH